MNHAIEPYFETDSSIVEIEQGETKVNVRLHALDLRQRLATYQIAVANAHFAAVSCRFYVIEPEAPELEVGTLEVAPGSIVRSRFAVPLDRWGRTGRVFVKVEGAGIEFTTEAPQPQPEQPLKNGDIVPLLFPAAIRNGVANGAHPAPPAIPPDDTPSVTPVSVTEAPPAPARKPAKKSRAWIAYLAGFLAVTTVGGAGIAAFTFGKPPDIVLSVPEHVAPGLVDARYAIGGVGGAASVTYEAAEVEGRLVASGMLSQPNGEIAFIVPPDDAGRMVRLSVTAQSWFGKRTKSAQFSVLAPARKVPKMQPAGGSYAQIGTLVAQRDALDGRPGVLASYVASGQRGMVQVSDLRGAVLGTAPFSSGGTTRVALSHDDPNQPLFARLVVEGSSSQAQASFEIPAEASAVGAPPRAAAAAPSPPPPAVDNSPIKVTSQAFSVQPHIVGGLPFEVKIHHVLPQMVLALQDGGGSILDETDVMPDYRSVMFQAPASNVVRTFFLVCKYGRDTGEESSVQPIRVYPH